MNARQLLLHQTSALLTEAVTYPEDDPRLQAMSRAVAALRAVVKLEVSIQVSDSTTGATILVGS